MSDSSSGRGGRSGGGTKSALPIDPRGPESSPDRGSGGEPIIVDPNRRGIQWVPWPDPSLPPGPKDTAQPNHENRTEPCLATGSYVPIVYGRVYMAPDVFYGYVYSRGNDTQIRMAMGFSEGEIEGFESWWIDELHQIPTSSPPNDYFETKIEKTGTLTQAAIANDFGVGHGQLPSLAYVYAEMNWNVAVIPKAIVKGRKLFDPRLGAWVSGDEPPSAYCAYDSGGALQSANPALQMADLLTSTRYGAGVPCTLVDWTSVIYAANYCDQLVGGEKRFECHIAIRDRDSLDSWMKLIGLHFGGSWQIRNGYWYLSVHQPTAVAAYLTEDDLVSSPKLSRQGGAGLVDQPNRVTVEWVDPASEWKLQTLPIPGPEVEAGEAVREASSSYKLHGCQKVAQAYRTGWYLLNVAAADMTIEVEVMPKWKNLGVGDVVGFTDEGTGLSATTFTITDIGVNEDSLTLKGREYDADIWNPSAYTSSPLPGGTPDLSPTGTPPEIYDLFASDGANGEMRVYWSHPLATVAERFASGWSVTNGTSVTLSRINDGDISNLAFTFGATFPWPSPREVTLDLGAGNTREFIGVVLTMASRPTGSVVWSVQYSDDGSSWTSVSTGTRVTQANSATGSKWIVEYRWNAGGAHRYWKAIESSALYQFTQRDYHEVQFLTSAGIYPWVKYFEVRATVGAETRVVQTIPVASIPSASVPFDTEPYWYYTGAADTSLFPVFGGNVCQYLDLTIVVVSVLDKRSEGRGLFWRRLPGSSQGSRGGSSAMRAYANIPGQASLPAVSEAGKALVAVSSNKYQLSENAGAFSPVLTKDGATKGVELQSSSPGSAQTGHANITGTALVGKLGKTGGATAWTPPAAEGSSGQAFTTDGAGGMAFRDIPDTSVLLRVTRTLGATVGAWVEIGSFASAQGAASLLVYCMADTSGSTNAKTFGVNAVYYGGVAGYFAATPLGNRAVATNDFEVDVSTSYGTTTMRLRRIASDGFTSLSVAVLVTGTLGASPTVTPLSGSGTGATISGVHNAGADVHPGSMQIWGTASAPAGYLLCDGSAISRTTYARLFSVIGTTFGSGDGTTTFNVPDFRQRFPLGKAASGTGSTLGGSGGSIDHVHSVDPGAFSSAGRVDSGTAVLAAGSDYQRSHTHSVDVPSTTSSSANPPFLAINVIIRF